MRSTKLTKMFSFLTAALSASVALYLSYRIAENGLAEALLFQIITELFVPIALFTGAMAYAIHVGKLDPVVAWSFNAWRRADYNLALHRLRLLSWGGRRAPIESIFMTSANFPVEAYAVAIHSSLSETDIEDPTYNSDFAAGRAAISNAFTKNFPFQPLPVMLLAIYFFGKTTNRKEPSNF